MTLPLKDSRMERCSDQSEHYKDWNSACAVSVPDIVSVRDSKLASEASL
jgi:hypothetical protein